MSKQYLFPENFDWGVATAAYQIEGAASEDGRGESIWDRYSHIPGNIRGGANGDIACDFYHRYEEDIALAEKLGIKTFRLSLSWPRLFPEGTGDVNKAGVEYYTNVLQCLHSHGIKAAVTLYHWDLPQKLQEKGGWCNRDSALWFEDFAKAAYKLFGGLVDKWITLNEPQSSAMGGNFLGCHAPGYHDYSSALLVIHNLLRAHGAAVKAYRKTGLTAEIGIALDMHTFYPFDDSNEKDVQITKMFHQQANELYSEPIMKGTYPHELFEYLETKGVRLPEIEEGDMELICQPLDFIGLNTYYTSVIQFDKKAWPLEGVPIPTKRAVTDAGWEVDPEGLYDLLKWFYETYKPKQIMITENGAACNDWVNLDGMVEDNNRQDYIKRYLIQAYRAIETGIPLTGYYVWCFTDNFEWSWGTDCRFGLVYIDYETQKRIPKKSAYWYSDVIKNNGF